MDEPPCRRFWAKTVGCRLRMTHSTVSASTATLRPCALRNMNLRFIQDFLGIFCVSWGTARLFLKYLYLFFSCTYRGIKFSSASARYASFCFVDSVRIVISRAHTAIRSLFSRRRYLLRARSFGAYYNVSTHRHCDLLGAGVINILPHFARPLQPGCIFLAIAYDFILLRFVLLFSGIHLSCVYRHSIPFFSCLKLCVAFSRHFLLDRCGTRSGEQVEQVWNARLTKRAPWNRYLNITLHRAFNEPVLITMVPYKVPACCVRAAIWYMERYPLFRILPGTHRARSANAGTCGAAPRTQTTDVFITSLCWCGALKHAASWCHPTGNLGTNDAPRDSSPAA